MKKTIIALLLTGLLAGCGANGNNSSKDSSSSATKSSKVASKTKKDSDSKKASSSSSAAASSSSSVASSSSATTSTGNHYNDVTTAAKKQVGEQWLPSRISSSAKYVNATASGSSSNSVVKFYGGNNAVDLNDSSLQGTADFTLTKKTYGSTAAAAAAINWIDSDSTLPTVNLGDNQIATKEGAAGSTYLHWNEGNWSITVQASNQANQDPTALGKQLVEIFRTKSLPAPTTHGAAQFNMNAASGLQSISWNSGATVYVLTGSSAIATAESAVR